MPLSHFTSGSSLYPLPQGESSPFPFYPEGEEMNMIEELPDGSAVYGVAEEEEEIEKSKIKKNFYENLAEKIPEPELTKIAEDIIEGIEQDRESRQQWENNYIEALKYLGYKLEDFKNVPFTSACRAYDTTFSNAHLRFYSTARAELFPQDGPVNFEIRGERTEESEEKGNTIKDWMNYYLTCEDKDYYPDSERLLFYLGLVGCAFRKVYIDPITNRPLARFIDPQDFIVNNDCVSILSSDRLTHVEHLSRKEIRLRQINEYYREVDLPGVSEDDPDEGEDKTKEAVHRLEGIETSSYEKNHIFDVYESHVELELDEYDYFEKDSEKISLPLPYIVSICATTRKVLSIRRNWKEDDLFYKRIDYFVQYNYLPGFGIYGMGMAQLLGSNSIVLTSLLRQLVDKGTLCNFPGGLRVTGMRMEENNKAIAPGEFREIETGGLPIRDAISPMPYSEPSQVLNALRIDVREQMQMLSSTTESQIAESNADAPVGTTLALLEVSNKVQATVFRTLRHSLTEEVGLLYNLFKNNIGDDAYHFAIPGKNLTITNQDFDENIKIIPIADPHLTTSTQRILRAEALLRTAQSAPQLHDLRAIYKRVYEAMGISDIEHILPAPEEAIPLDPITENMNAMQGKPLKAALWQDHQAHNTVHMADLQNPNVPEDVKPLLMAHIKEHMAMDYLMKMQMMMQTQVPPEEMLKNPEVQNSIAIKAAQVIQQQMEQQQQQIQQQQPIDPGEVAMADIAQRRDEVLSNERVADQKAQTDERIADKKAETEVFKSQLNFEAEKIKLDSQKEMAQGNNDVKLELVHIKEEERLKERKWSNMFGLRNNR